MQKVLSSIYQIGIIPDPFPFPIPLCAWREFHSFSLVLSTYPKKPFRTEKSSIFNFRYVKEVWATGLLGVNSERIFQPRAFQPWTHGSKVHGWQVQDGKAWGWKFYGFKTWVWKDSFGFGVKKSRVGKFIVEKSGVERSGVEVWGWNVLQPFHTL